MASEGDPPPDHTQSSNKGEGSASFLRAARAGNLDKVLELLRSGTDINTCNANGLNALHLASKEGHSEVVRELLKRKALVDAATKKGNTALHIASLAGQSLIVTILVENGANVNVQSLNGFTPLYMAAQENHEDVVRFLLSYGANQALSTEDGFTPLAVALQQGHDRVVAVLLENDTRGKVRLPALHIAAKKDDTRAATLLLQNDHNADVTSKSGFTPLHIAAHYGNENVAQLLLEKGANVNYQARHNISPLHVATKWGRTNMVQLLLANGAIIDSRTRDLLTPLHCASRSGHDQVVDMLLEKGAPISAKTKVRNGLAPLHMAAQGDHVDSARILLYHRAPVDDVTVDYLTPLHVAAHCGHVRKIESRLVLIIFTTGLSPLHVASFMGAINIVIYLLQQIFQLHVHIEFYQNYTGMLDKKRIILIFWLPNYFSNVVLLLILKEKIKLHHFMLLLTIITIRLVQLKHYSYIVLSIILILIYDFIQVAMLLLEHGASATAAAKNGYTPLHIAAKKNQMDIASTLLQYHVNADPNAKSRAGFTPLHLAAQEGHREISAMFIENGSDVSVGAKANNGLTAMHLCAQEDRVPVAIELVKHNAEVNSQTNAGYTPLHVACHFGQLNMVRFLVEHGAHVSEKTHASYTPLHQAAQQGHNNCVRYLLEHGASPNAQTANGQTPLSIAQRLGYVSVVETLKTVTETTVITETTTVTEERYKPQNPEAMNETMFSESEDEGAAAEHEAATAHVKDFSDTLTQGLADSTGVHMIHIGEQLLSKSAELDGGAKLATDGTDNLDELIRRAQVEPVSTAVHDSSIMDHSSTNDNIPIGHNVSQPSFLISFLVDARGGAMRGCRHSGVRIIIPPRKASQPIRVTCRYLRKDKLAHPPPLSEGEELASRILEMAPAGAKFLGPVILESYYYNLSYQLEATEDAVQEVLNESFDAEELAQLDDLHTPRITRILTNDFPMYFAVVTRVRQEVHCVGPEGGVIMSSVVPRVQAIFPDGSLTKTIKVSVQAQPVPQDMVTRLHGNRVAVSPIVTVEPRRRKFHKPITLCIPLPQSSNKGMLTQYSGQPGQEPPTLRLLCSITGGSAPAQWEDITGTTQLTFTGDEVSFTTTVSARFWLMDCQTPRDAARMAQEVYNEAISIPYMAKFAVFARRTFPVEGQLRVFCMTDDKEDKTLEKQEHFKLIAKSRDVEVCPCFVIVIITITIIFQNRNIILRNVIYELHLRYELNHCLLSNQYMPTPIVIKKDTTPFDKKYMDTLNKELPDFIHQNVVKGVGADWQRLARALELPHRDIQYIRQNYPGKELTNVLKIWIHMKKEEANCMFFLIHEILLTDSLDNALRRIGRDDIVRSIAHGEPDSLSYGGGSDSPASKRFDPPKYVEFPPVVVSRHEIRHEESTIEEPIKEVSLVAITFWKSLNYDNHILLHFLEAIQFLDEAPVSVVRTVVRTERHVHDTEIGPMVEERTITTTYEDDVAVNEHVVDKTVSLNEQEVAKWEELNRLASQPPLSEDNSDQKLPEGVEQEVETEKHTEEDGTIVTTTTVKSHYTSQSPAPISEGHKDEDQDELQAVSLKVSLAAMSSPMLVLSGVTICGLPICHGLVLHGAIEGTSAPAVHHVSSANKFEAESWSGEHEEAFHDDEIRRMSMTFEQQEIPRDEGTPIATSSQFERVRSASLAAALLDVDPKGVPLVHFFHPSQEVPLLEAEEHEETEPNTTDGVGEAEKVLSNLLFTLRELKMAVPDKHAEAVNRLKELEEELRTAGAVTPADPAVSEAVARALAASGPASGTTDSSIDSGTTQKKETAEEGFTNEDGSIVVSKKMTRVVTTTKTTLPGWQ
uniref:ANK_REP_REGION domain-containing protein n=1 Tax=Heterorhabditis bacteriophora TaxID=37862 RepID=A0A1I7XJ33_HETBA